MSELTLELASELTSELQSTEMRSGFPGAEKARPKSAVAASSRPSFWACLPRVMYSPGEPSAK